LALQKFYTIILW